MEKLLYYSSQIKNACLSVIFKKFIHQVGDFKKIFFLIQVELGLVWMIPHFIRICFHVGTEFI